MLSDAALLKRINRKLAASGTQVRKAGGSYWQARWGTFYLYDIACQRVVTSKVQPHQLAQQLGVSTE